MNIVCDDLTSVATKELIALHFANMRESSPPCGAHVLSIESLSSRDISVWTAWDGSTIMGIGALKQLASDYGEIKSMRTHPDHLRKGVAAAILETIIEEAYRRGFRTLSLETGTGPSFEPAIALYQRYGFFEGERFKNYEDNGFSRFFHLRIASRNSPSRA